MPFDFVQWAFWAKKLIAVLILPPAGPLLLIGLGLALRRLRALAWLGWLYALVASMPATVNALALWLEPQRQVSLAEVRDTGAIVILGAGVRRHAPEFEGSTVNALALERLRYGARLARASGAPVLVSGGAPHHGINESRLMRDILQDEYGIPVRWTESASLDTRDNAVFSAALLRSAGVERITLVTHAAHMPRAQRAFEAAGLRVVPAPTSAFGNPDIDYVWGDFIPNAKSAYGGWLVIHEWVGNLAYRVSEPSPEPSSRISDRAIQPSNTTPASSTPQNIH